MVKVRDISGVGGYLHPGPTMIDLGTRPCLIKKVVRGTGILVNKSNRLRVVVNPRPWCTLQQTPAWHRCEQWRFFIMVVKSDHDPYFSEKDYRVH